MVSLFGFECRLGAQPSDAGFAMAITRGAEAEALAGHPSGATFLRQPHWRRLRDFCVAWADVSSVLHREVRNVWIELDVGPSGAVAPTANVFMGLQHGIRRSGCEAVIPGPRPIQAALRALAGRWMSDSVAHSLFGCVDRLPPQADVFQIGAMAAREDGPLRICISGLAPGQIVPYLSEIGWPGDRRQVATLAGDLERLVSRIDLALDLSDQIGPRIGLECPFLPRRAPRFHARWEAFVAYLAERGLCSTAKRDALMSYPGFSHERTESERWPQALLDLSAFLGSARLSTVVRALHHVKISCQSGCPLEAKAYLAVQHQWLPIERVGSSVSRSAS